jgi:DNA-binding response OmpR family regulator
MAAPAGPLKILLVEDEALLKLPIEDALAARGFACLSTGTLDGALKILRTERVAAAILDVNIQGTAVFNVARELRAQGAPCVFTTGYTDASIPAEFADAPYFHKPYNIDHVVDAIAACATRAGGA